MDSNLFQTPHETSADWAIAKSFFCQLVDVIRLKVRWPGNAGDIVELDKEDSEAFETWRRDAGEVIVGA